MSSPSMGAFLVIWNLLGYYWILNILALIGIVTVLFCELYCEVIIQKINVKEPFVFSIL